MRPRHWIAIAAAVTLLAACGGRTGEAEPTAETAAPETGSDGAEAPADTLFVYGAFATPIEEPWDGAIHSALQEAVDDGLITYEYVDNIGYAGGMERTLRDIARDEQPDVIFGDAFGIEDAVRNVAKEFPEVAFVFGSGEDEQAPNMSVFDNWIHDPAYLAGMLAGGMTERNVLGVVGGYPVPEVNRIVNAFIAGAQSVNSQVQVKVSFINSWFDPATAKQAALAQVAAGADVLFAERAGVIEAAQESGLLSIGMMVDQEHLAPKTVMTSVVWDMTPTVGAVIEQVTTGTYGAANLKEYSFMMNDGSSLAPINTDVTGGIPDDLVAGVESKTEAIKAGEFTTPVDESTPAGSVEVQSDQ